MIVVPFKSHTCGTEKHGNCRPQSSRPRNEARVRCMVRPPRIAEFDANYNQGSGRVENNNCYVDEGPNYVFSKLWHLKGSR
jgi:hypothetical protein